VSPDGRVLFGFHRLAINDVHPTGHQPFFHPKKKIVVICNGEIYNYTQLADEFRDKLIGTSDCEVLMWMYEKYGAEETFKRLDGVFAIVIYDGDTDTVYAGRDPYGVRPMFIGINQDSIAMCSEMKGIHDICEKGERCIQQVPPGNYLAVELNIGEFGGYTEYHNYRYRPDQSLQFLGDFDSVAERVCTIIRERLVNAVCKRVHLTDRPIGCLLSGGLDSSLISSIVSSHFDDPKMLHTFSIGMEGGTDLEYARKVADFIGSTHHEILTTEEQFAETAALIIPGLIESWDTTTIRASVGNYLVSKYISENTDIKVVFNGDGSDELFGGYLYFNKAPDAKSFREECMRLLRNIHFYDGLRSDRCISECGLEARTPFLDLELVECVQSIPERWRMMAHSKMEKWFLRAAFDFTKFSTKKKYLPDEVLWRRKEAFSDGVSNTGRTTQTIIQEYLENRKHGMGMEDSTGLELEKRYYKFQFYESYDTRESVIPGEWLPKWCGDVSDPSARELEHYQK
jgi:asparagine synthase (glutamine-hydrolysing)